MSKWTTAIPAWGFALVFAFGAAPALAQSAPAPASGTGDILDHIINVPGVGAWNVWNAQASPRKDAAVQGGRAIRVAVPKREHSWEAAASIAITKPVKQGDAILAAFWARVEVPPAGRTTAILAQIGVGMVKAPYTGLFGEPAEAGPAWKMYYASGVADRDYQAGELNMSVQLAAAEQTLDLGPAFVVDLGPDYDRTKLPHNAAAAPANPQSSLSAALAKIQAGLPVKGTPISNPALGAFVYGNGQTNTQIAAPEIPGGQAIHVTVAQKPANPWDIGASLPILGDIHKGDALVMVAYVRVVDPAAGAGTISSMGISLGKNPWTRIIGADVAPAAGGWHALTVRGISPIDAKAGDLGAGFQLGGAKQTLDIGPVFVLNLGQGVDPAKLSAP